MYIPELTLANFMRTYGTTSTKEAAPAELPLVIGMIFHMYMRLWTPNDDTSIDVRSVPYALQRSNNAGAQSAMSIYKSSIQSSDKLTLISYTTFDAMCTFYGLYDIARESPLFDSVLQAVTLVWCRFNKKDKFMLNKVLPDLSTGTYIDIAGTRCIFTDDDAFNILNLPLYTRYLSHILSCSNDLGMSLIDNKHYREKIIQHIHHQKIGNINPYCIVGMAKQIACKNSDITWVADHDRPMRGNNTDSDPAERIFNTWSALYFLPIIKNRDLAYADIRYTLLFSTAVNRSTVAFGAEASVFDAIDKLDVPNKGDEVESSNSVDLEDTTAEKYETDATTNNDKPKDDLGVENEPTETNTDDVSNNNNNVGEQGTSGDTVQSALKLYFLRMKIIRLFKLAKEKGIAGDLLSVVPMLYLLEKTDLTKLQSRLVSVLNKSSNL